MEKFETFVINLERRKDRLESFLQRFPGTGNAKKLKIFKAIDGNNLNYDSPALHHVLKESIEQRHLKLTLNSGEIGCLLSHVSLWKKIVDENIPFAHIYEDDALFSENFVTRIKKVFENTFGINPPPAIVYTGGRKHKNYVTKNITKTIGNLVAHSKKNWNRHVKDLDRWLHAYIISNRGAGLLLDMVFNHFNGKLGIDQAVVMFLNKSSEETYSANPLLCYSIPQGDSDIRNWGIKQNYCPFSLQDKVNLIKFPQFIQHEDDITDSLNPDVKEKCEDLYGREVDDDFKNISNCHQGYDNLFLPHHRLQHNFNVDTTLYINKFRYSNCSQIGVITDDEDSGMGDDFILCGGGSKIPNQLIVKDLDFSSVCGHSDTPGENCVRFDTHRWKDAAAGTIYKQNYHSAFIDVWDILNGQIVGEVKEEAKFQVIFEHAIPQLTNNIEKISIYQDGRVGDDTYLWAEVTSENFQTHGGADVDNEDVLDCTLKPGNVDLNIDDEMLTKCTSLNRPNLPFRDLSNYQKMNSLSLISQYNRLVLKIIKPDVAPRAADGKITINLYVTKNTDAYLSDSKKCTGTDQSCASNDDCDAGKTCNYDESTLSSFGKRLTLLAACTRIEHAAHLNDFHFKCEDNNATWDPKREQCVDSCNTRCWHKITLNLENVPTSSQS